MARQLSKVLDYTDFKNFTVVIEKAWNACKNSGNDPKDRIVASQQDGENWFRSRKRNTNL